MFHKTVRIYSNGDFVTNDVFEDDLENHKDYNLTFRPGCAFFVDGNLVDSGCLMSEDEALLRYNKIKDKIGSTSYPKLPYV